MTQITLGAVTLPPDLQWSDEFAWVALGMTAKVSLTGAEIVQSGSLQASRPITLQGGQDFAWLDYVTVEALRTLASAAGATYTLTLPDARTFTVRFRGEDTPVEATPVMHRASPDTGVRNALQYVPIIRLKTV
ncbi:MAG: hypothetical protein ABIU96_03915 [Rhodanobacter sp.]